MWIRILRGSRVREKCVHWKSRMETFDPDQESALPRAHFYMSLEYVRWYCQVQCVFFLGVVSKISSHSEADLRTKEPLTFQYYRCCGKEAFSLPPSALTISSPSICSVDVQNAILLLIKLYTYFSISQIGTIFEGMFFCFSWLQFFLVPQVSAFHG